MSNADANGFLQVVAGIFAVLLLLGLFGAYVARIRLRTPRLAEPVEVESVPRKAVVRDNTKRAGDENDGSEVTQ